MPEQQDSTHSRNIASMAAAAAVCLELGARYAPDDEAIRPDAVKAFCTNCEVNLGAAYSKERAFNDAREARRLLFEGEAPFCTRIVNTLKSSKASEGTVSEARGLVLKIRGERLSAKVKPASSGTPAEEIGQQISVAQTSFENRTEHFRKLVSLCSNLRDAYKAPTDDLKLPKLEERLAQMSAANGTVAGTGTAYTNALIARDRLLYGKDAGLVTRMEAIRAWFTSAFGASSAERKLLNGLNVRDLSVRRLNAV